MGPEEEQPEDDLREIEPGNEVGMFSTIPNNGHPFRTYYEKEILVPVPKSGLYPKKLVYKFGSSAHGWRMAASLAVQTHLASANGPSLAL